MTAKSKRSIYSPDFFERGGALDRFVEGPGGIIAAVFLLFAMPFGCVPY